jgi:hypothetical protein
MVFVVMMSVFYGWEIILVYDFLAHENVRDCDDENDHDHDHAQIRVHDCGQTLHHCDDDHHLFRCGQRLSVGLRPILPIERKMKRMLYSFINYIRFYLSNFDFGIPDDVSSFFILHKIVFNII